MMRPNCCETVKLLSVRHCSFVAPPHLARGPVDILSPERRPRFPPELYDHRAQTARRRCRQPRKRRAASAKAAHLSRFACTLSTVEDSTNILRRPSSSLGETMRPTDSLPTLISTAATSRSYANTIKTI